MAGMLLNWAGPDLVVPQQAPVDLAVAPNFERFDGLTPLDNPAGNQQLVYFDGKTPRPGQQPTPDEYTLGAIPGVVGVIGGQPLAAARTSPRITRPEGTTQLVTEYNTQSRFGVGQDYQGVAQTVALANLTNNPPVPDGMETILGGYG